ncbi:MAG: nucleotide exchange factor GrpE [Lachnospiraceae bacterium]|nr:nucleotide exchange factor GrpE [Lachnospiraceae bacterium]
MSEEAVSQGGGNADGNSSKAEEADAQEGSAAGTVGESAKGSQADAADAGTSEEESEKKGFFGRKKKEKDKRDQQIEELTDRVQRQMAEFDNFRKRSEKEKAAMFEVGAKSVLEKILPTVDNFERGFANLSEEQKQDAFVQGMEKVYRQLLTTLDGIGVKPIEAVGQPFDPNFHNAVMHVEDEESGENIVVEEFQKGYMYRDSVLRHSMVKVAN